MGSNPVRKTTLKVSNMNLSADVPETYDNVHNPKHYLAASVTLQPKDVMTYLPSHLANAFKYICRAGLKNDENEDLNKALEYIRYFELNKKDQLIHPNALAILKLYISLENNSFFFGKRIEKAKSVPKLFRAIADNIREVLDWRERSNREYQLVNEICRLRKKRLTYSGLERDPELINYLVGP